MVAASAFAALSANELILDLQLAPHEGRLLACRDPSPFWAHFERCRGIEEHMFWVAAIAAVTATVSMALVVKRSRVRPGSASVIAASLLAFGAVVTWGFFFEIGSLPDNV